MQFALNFGYFIHLDTDIHINTILSNTIYVLPIRQEIKHFFHVYKMKLKPYFGI
jgi:hypothetical protein